ncbi:8114_t:CDS:2, partial [Funneliformis caledonium]
MNKGTSRNCFKRDKHHGIRPVEESSSNNLDKEKTPEIIASTSTTSENAVPKPTISVDESFDASENTLDTTIIGFDAPSTQ